MSKYRSSSVLRTRERNKQPHYIWRGIGCVMILLIPAISIAAGYESIKFALDEGYPIPYQLLGLPRFPDIFYASRGLMNILAPIARTPHFYAIAAASLIYIILLGGLLSFGYAVIYRMIGPSRYGPLDAPPPKIKTKTYKR